MKMIILCLLSLSFISCSGMRQKTTSTIVKKRGIASSFENKIIVGQKSFFFQDIRKNTLVTCGKTGDLLGGGGDPCHITPHLPVCNPDRIVKLGKGESIIITPGEAVFVECAD